MICNRREVSKMGHMREFLGATYHLISVQPLIINHGDEEAIALFRIGITRAEARLLDQAARPWGKVLDFSSLVVETCQGVEALI
jgi:hypothetical protein